MIGKILHNQSFEASTKYITRPGAILLGGNMLGRTAAEIVGEFQMIQALRPDLKRPVVHLIGAFSTTDRLSDAEMLEVATKYLVGLGYEDSLFTIWRHLDATTDHFHILTGQMDIDGKTISQSFERFLNKRLCRELELEYGLQVVNNLRKEAPKPPPSSLPAVEPDGLDIELPSATTVVSDYLCKEINVVIPSCKSIGDLAQALYLRGIAMVPQVHSENGQVYGMGFRIEAGPLSGSFITGSRVPGNYSPRKLVSKHGLTFDPERDLPILRNPSPPPKEAVEAPQKPPKPRRKKKGERQNARHQRKHTRRDPTEFGPSPWHWIGSSPEVLSPYGPSAAATRLGGEILANPYSRTASFEPSRESLFASVSTNAWGVAGHH
jgi:hypothetical protein